MEPVALAQSSSLLISTSVSLLRSISINEYWFREMGSKSSGDSYAPSALYSLNTCAHAHTPVQNILKLIDF